MPTDLTTVNATLLNAVLAINNLSKTIAAVFPLSSYTGSKAFNPPSIASGAQTSTTVTVTGAAQGDSSVAAFSLDLGGVVLSSYVSAADTVTCVFSNLTGSPVDLGSGTLSARVFG